MEILDDITHFLNKTKAELPALAVAGGLIFGVASAYLSNWREHCYTLQFSERTQIERDATARGEKPTANTIYNANVLDISMKTFEANNKGMLYPKDKDRHFAELLKEKFRETSHHYNLEGLTKTFPEDVAQLKEELSFFYKAVPAINSANEGLKNSWDHEEHDQYLPLPESYTYYTTDSKGNSQSHYGTRIVLKHVWTDHTFTLDRIKAQSNLQKVNDSLNTQVKKTSTALPAPSRINNENKLAIIKSRKQANTKDKTTEGQAEEIAISWGAYAQIPTLINDAQQKVEIAQRGSQKLRTIFQTTGSPHKSRTYTPMAALATSGMISSMVVGSLEGNSKEPPKGWSFYLGYINNLEKITTPVVQADEILNNSQTIVAKMRENLEQIANAPVITSQEIKLAKKTRNLAEELTEKNFTKGIPVPMGRGYIPILWGLLGAALGAAVGFAIDWGAEEYQERKHRTDNGFRNLY